jgi:septal ring factor EnvC (AmiA/AmiB activator)
MPSPKDVDTLSLVLDSHEDRLQNIEHKTQDVAEKIAEIGVKQDFTQTFLEQKFSDLKETHSNILKAVEKHEIRLDSHEDRLKPVETSVAASSQATNNRKEFYKKVFVGVVLAGAGVFGTKGVEWLLGWLGQ